MKSSIYTPNKSGERAHLFRCCRTSGKGDFPTSLKVLSLLNSGRHPQLSARMSKKAIFRKEENLVLTLAEMLNVGWIRLEQTKAEN